MKIRLWKRCPCIGCLVDPTCTDPCKDYSDFIGPVKKKMDCLTKFFAWADDCIEAVTERYPRLNKLAEFLFDKFGVIFVLPIIWLILRFVWGLRFPFDQKIKGDVREMRCSEWERQQQ